MKTYLVIILALSSWLNAQLIPPTTAECATSNDGSVVGTQNPLNPPQLTTAGFGSLTAGTYFVAIAWVDAASHVTLASPEAQIQLLSTGSISAAPPIGGVPATASGMQVFVGTASGNETLQGTTSPVTTWYQGIALVTGTALPAVNNTVCQIIANDAGWPTGTGYNTTITTPAGNTLAGYPQQWQLLGPGNTINLSNGLPLYNGTVTYPIPIMARPYNHGPQSISGPLSLGAYGLTAGTLNISGASALLGGGTLNGTFGGNPTFSGLPVFGAANFTTGIQLGGSFGTTGYFLQSTGSGTTFAPIAHTAYAATGRGTNWAASTTALQPSVFLAPSPSINHTFATFRFSFGARIAAAAGVGSLRFGVVAGATQNFIPLATGSITQTFHAAGDVVCTTIVTGASGFLECSGPGINTDAAAVDINEGIDVGPLDLTSGTIRIGLACQFTSASASNFCNQYTVVLENLQ